MVITVKDKINGKIITVMNPIINLVFNFINARPCFQIITIITCLYPHYTKLSRNIYKLFLKEDAAKSNFTTSSNKSHYILFTNKLLMFPLYLIFPMVNLNHCDQSVHKLLSACRLDVEGLTF